MAEAEQKGSGGATEGVRAAGRTSGPNAWEERWQAGRTGWDQSFSHPILVSFLASSTAESIGVLEAKTAFVPGCGSGYDVHLLASYGMDTIGLDVAPTAVEAAKKRLAAQPATTGTTDVVCADFFTYQPEKPFDLIYDYTFLCALPPALRKQWASTLLRLTHPDPDTNTSATLITLMYPLPPTANPEGGPPFALSREIYDELLGDQWESVWERDVPVEMKRKGGGPGEEKLVVWKRRRISGGD